MQLSVPGTRSMGRLATMLAPVMLAFAAACSSDSGDNSPQGPVLPPAPPSNPQLRQAAFILDVDMRKGTVKVTEPTTGLQNLSLIGGFDGGPSYSIVGGDVLEVVTSGFAVTAGGGFPSGTIPVGPCPGGSPAAVPGRLCVEFDVSVINELTSVQLVGPAVFPTAPAGTTGPLLFPFDVVTTTTTGGTSTGGLQGNDVIVELPSSGEVSINEEWAGAPHNFFNDTPCPAGGNGTAQGSSDCFRWEEITPTPLPGTATSNPNRVGFYIDPTVGTYRVRFLVAADLQNQGAAASGSIGGTVSSPQLGLLSGVQVTVSGIAGTQTTDGQGLYNFATVGLGPRQVSITGGLPGGCAAPAPQNITVANGVPSTVNFTVTCPVPVGTITGTLTSSLGGGPLAGISVTITPAGGSALAPVLTSAAGLYSNAAVPLGTPSGTGTITFAAIPAGCINPGPTPYTGLTANGTINVSLTLTCTPPPAVYVLRGTWGGAGSSRVYTLTYDLTGRDDPAIPGLDDVFVISGTTRFAGVTAAGISYSGSSNVTGSLLQNQGSNNVTTAGVTPAGAADIAWLNFNTDVNRATGNVGVININFAGTPTGAVTPLTSFGPTDDVQSTNGVNLLPNTTLSEAVLTP
jgi:hypothetical protein